MLGFKKKKSNNWISARNCIKNSETKKKVVKSKIREASMEIRAIIPVKRQRGKT